MGNKTSQFLASSCPAISTLFDTYIFLDANLLRRLLDHDLSAENVNQGKFEKNGEISYPKEIILEIKI